MGYRDAHFWSLAPDIVVGTIFLQLEEDANSQQVMCSQFHLHGPTNVLVLFKVALRYADAEQSHPHDASLC
jgi:hypothetical protein